MTISDLRPRSIGELLRLALAVFARCWLPLLAVLCVVLVPADVAFGVVMHALDGVVLPERAGAAPALPGSFYAGLVAVFAAVAVLGPIAAGAAFSVVGATLDGVPMGPPAALRSGARRWLTQFAVDVVCYVVLMAVSWAVMLVAFLIVFVPLAGSGALPQPASQSGAAGPAATIAIPFVLVAYVLVGAVFAVGAMVWMSAKMSAALETGSPLVAIAAAWSRVINRRYFWRTFWFVIAVGLAEFAFECVFLGLPMTLLMPSVPASGAGVSAHIPLAAVAAICIVTVPIVMERMVLTTVYTRDLAVRLEGLDLARSAATVRELPADADGLDADDRALIAAFLARRASLQPAPARALAATIAGRVRPKLRASFAHLDDEALLEHLGRPQN